MVARHVLTIIAVTDLAASQRFYDQAFAWTRPVDTPVYTEYALPGGQRLGHCAREGFARNTGQLPLALAAGELNSTELYFYVDDMEAAVTSLVGAGARQLSELAARDCGDVAAYYADPDGNVIVVATPAE